MSVARPVRCLLSKRLATAVKPTTAAAAGQPPCHATFHSSAQLAGRRRPRFKSIRAEEMGLVTPQKVEEYAKKTFPGYSPEEMEILRQRYTPEQMAALEAGEAAIDLKDLTIQGRLRRDPYRLPYLDDFSKILPIVDKRPKTAPPPDPKARFLTPEENFDDMAKWMGDLVPPELRHLLQSSEISEEELEERLADMSPEEADREREAYQRSLGQAEEERMKPLYDHLERVMPLESTKFFNERTALTDGADESNSALAPELGKKLRGVYGMYKPPIDPADGGLDDTGVYQDLKRRTGLSVRDILRVNSKILVTRQVDNQTRLGKIRSQWVLAIAGNGNGRLGVGEAKSVEPAVANLKAKLLAIQNMQPVRRYEDRTIFGRVKAKVGATIVEIASRPPGFGLRASHRLFEIFRAVGIHDIAAKMPRGRNPMNSVKACVQALHSQKDPNELAVGRGKKLVDVRKVYYGGNVY
ncbi:hypothetical protein DL766_007494 [Monosporascus sp. MC13-8B]|uniref:S5 DRBM domain-containing protein n=1 Tax=Monosporascus cannonballus TaxID=155416 RepID=A0ABY0GVK1_9PEZI|nr:hypothetical protein DL762_008647 [Monosporascus cannonballus]RYO82902.1 hypothetical protein DL763_008077 [Monosporascus cannonballus]RYP23611.1 hypothetical protein DL766_007494 [Monosporascus sp. MC13-8B]